MDRVEPANRQPEMRITATLLSGKPRHESVPVSLLAGMMLVLGALLCWGDPELYARLSASRDLAIGQREYWRLLGTICIHADFAHLGVNTILVLFFGYLLYGYFGFWIYPAVMPLLASLTNLLSLMTYPPETVLIGASGLVYVMMGFWLVMFGAVERTIPLRKRLLRITGFAVIVLVPTTVQPEVSYRTHFIGAAVGAVAGAVYFLVNWRRIRGAEIVRVEIPDEI
jgi:rhomboid protease GluP